jgi:hypothetical protein
MYTHAYCRNIEHLYIYNSICVDKAYFDINTGPVLILTFYRPNEAKKIRIFSTSHIIVQNPSVTDTSELHLIMKLTMEEAKKNACYKPFLSFAQTSSGNAVGIMAYRGHARFQIYKMKILWIEVILT